MKNLFQKFDNLSIGQQELVNFVFSLLLALVLFAVLFFGVDDNGEFKSRMVEGVANFLVSIANFYVATLFFIPTFLLLLLKAALLGTPKYKYFNYIAQFITGIFYTLGSCFVVVAIVAVLFGIPFNSIIFWAGILVCLLGYGFYIIFQTAIQRTSTPQT